MHCYTSTGLKGRRGLLKLRYFQHWFDNGLLTLMVYRNLLGVK